MRVRYRSTGRYPAGTVIAQSRGRGAEVLPDSRIALVVAKAPPPPTTAPPPPPSTAPAPDCDPSYPDVCLDPDAVDYDCAGGSGNGPEYVEGPIRVRPPDPFDLDREGDGVGCEGPAEGGGSRPCPGGDGRYVAGRLDLHCRHGRW